MSESTQCRRCGAIGADSQGLCWDCVQVRSRWFEQMQRDKYNAAKLGWPEFPDEPKVPSYVKEIMKHMKDEMDRS